MASLSVQAVLRRATWTEVAEGQVFETRAGPLRGPVYAFGVDLLDVDPNYVGEVRNGSLNYAYVNGVLYEPSQHTPGLVVATEDRDGSTTYALYGGVQALWKAKITPDMMQLDL